MSFGGKLTSWWIFLPVMATLCSGVARGEEPDLSGYWFTQGYEDAFDQFIVARQPNGTFRKEIRTIEHCTVVHQWVEAGGWNVAAGNLHEYTTVVENKLVSYTDAFHIDDFSKSQVKMTDAATHHQWTFERVGPDARFPPLEGCPVS
jgi:hypothetical protein